MNLALPTLIIIFLLTPGLIYRRFYYTGAFSQQYFKSTFTDLLISTIIPSLLIHALLYQLIVKPNYDLDTKTLAILFSGTSDSNEIKLAFNRINQQASQIFTYLLIASVISSISGRLSQWIVRKTNLDKKTKFFRFGNQWHYLFSGEILEFPGMPGKTEDVDMLYIDALVDCNEGSIIYSGVLAEYVLSKDGGIDRFYLFDVKRRYLKDDISKSSYKMPGEYFVILFNQIINLHITYYSVTVNEEEGKEQ